MPLTRRVANALGTVTLSAAVGRWIHDNQSGYRLIGRRLMAAMLDSTESGFAFEVEMIAVTAPASAGSNRPASRKCSSGTS
jgi:hypothetical protein